MNHSIIYYTLFCANITFSIYAAQQPQQHPKETLRRDLDSFHSIDHSLKKFMDVTQVASESTNEPTRA